MMPVDSDPVRHLGSWVAAECSDRLPWSRSSAMFFGAWRAKNTYMSWHAG